jgi:hypothetical protein
MSLVPTSGHLASLPPPRPQGAARRTSARVTGPAQEGLPGDGHSRLCRHRDQPGATSRVMRRSRRHRHLNVSTTTVMPRVVSRRCSLTRRPARLLPQARQLRSSWGRRHGTALVRPSNAVSCQVIPAMRSFLEPGSRRAPFVSGPVARVVRAGVSDAPGRSASELRRKEGPQPPARVRRRWATSRSAALCGAVRSGTGDGPYWARTSDLRLVEPALSQLS